MSATNSADRPLTEPDVVVLTEIGRSTGIAIGNARLYRHAALAGATLTVTSPAADVVVTRTV